MSDNTLLAKHFYEIAEGYYTEENKWRKRAYQNAADTISKFRDKITSSDQLVGIKGFGKSTLEDVDEFLKTGSTARHKDLYINSSSKDNEKREIINLFLSVYGIGPQNAEYYYGLGYRDLQSLYNSGLLNDKQRIGVYYRDDISQRIPRSEIEYFGYELSKRIPTTAYVDYFTRNIYPIFNDTIPKGDIIRGREKYRGQQNIVSTIVDETTGRIEPIWHIAGSYRRNESSSGDIDLLARYIDMNYLLGVLQEMGFIVAELAYGETKYMGIIKVHPNAVARRIDIRIFNPNDYIYGLLYFTGSPKFNVLMRTRANELGASLNEYGLVDFYGTSYPVNNEEEVFKLLGIVYLTPEQRTRDISHLNYTEPGVPPTIRIGPSIVGKKQYYT